jgi:hypothetical protein
MAFSLLLDGRWEYTKKRWPLSEKRAALQKKGGVH